MGGVTMVDTNRLDRLQKAALVLQEMRFVSAVSGLQYDNPDASGDVSEIIWKGVRYKRSYGSHDVEKYYEE